MAAAKGLVAVASGEISPGGTVLFAIGKPSVVVHAYITASLAFAVDVVFIAAIGTAVIVHAGFLPASFLEAPAMVVIKYNLDPKVVNVCVPILSVRPGGVLEVNYTVFDYIAFDPGDVGRLFSPQN